MTSNNPSIIIASDSNTQSKSLIELITRQSRINQEGPHKCSQSWTIDTKYYTANVDIHGITDDFLLDEAFIETIRAVIIYVDCNSGVALSELNKWDYFVSECDAEVKLLTADYCDDRTNITLSEIGEWSTKHGFEFILLNPKVQVDQEEEEIIVEKMGVDRIIEVLQTCIWPNMQMKDKDKADKMGVSHCKMYDEQQAVKCDVYEDTLLEDGIDDFTELFGKLHLMKQSIQSLSDAERKQCAEQMVTAFWKAIGGDDEELQEL